MDLRIIKAILEEEEAFKKSEMTDGALVVEVVKQVSATPAVDAKELSDSLSCRPVDRGFEF